MRSLPRRFLARTGLALLVPLGLLGSVGNGSAALAEDGPAADGPAEHVILVSIDGLRPEFYLDPTWPAPMLRQLVASGAHAEAVRGVFPSVTYPSHTTMVTGTLPAGHGIYYNSPFEPEGQTGRWYWEAEAIRAPTLWQAVEAEGGVTASIGWPVTVGAEIDYLVPEIWSLDPDDDFIEYTRARCKPADLLAELEREATGRLRWENFTIDYMTRDDRAGDMAAYLFEQYRPNLLLLHLVETDHFQHEEGREGPRVRRSVAAVDRALAQVWETVERLGLLDRTAFVITGDHGHVDLHTELFPNTWLAEAGLVKPAEGTSKRGADWQATFHTSGAAAFLVLRDPSDGALVERVRQVLDARPKGIRELFRIVERQELEALGAHPEAVLALAPVPGVTMGSDVRGPDLRPTRGATHGYIPDFPHIQTGLVASGAGIREGAVASQLRLTDIAPLVAALLGLDFEAPDGALPAGFLEPADDADGGH